MAPKKTILFLSAALAATLVVSGAEARHRHHPRMIEVHKHARAFTDSGNVVPVGTRTRYIAEQTIYNSTPGGTYRREGTGWGLLPGPFDVPGFVPR